MELTHKHRAHQVRAKANLAWRCDACGRGPVDGGVHYLTLTVECFIVCSVCERIFALCEHLENLESLVCAIWRGLDGAGDDDAMECPF